MKTLKKMAKVGMKAAKAGMGDSKRFGIPGQTIPGSEFPKPKLTGGMGKGAFAFKGKK